MMMCCSSFKISEEGGNRLKCLVRGWGPNCFRYFKMNRKRYFICTDFQFSVYNALVCITYSFRISVNFDCSVLEDLEAICTNSPGQLRQLGVSSADIKLLVPAFYRPGAVHTRRVDSVATPKNVITTNISEESPRSEETIGGDKLDDVGFESLVSLLRPLFSGGDDLKVVVLARALVSVGIKCKRTF